MKAKYKIIQLVLYTLAIMAVPTILSQLGGIEITKRYVLQIILRMLTMLCGVLILKKKKRVTFNKNKFLKDGNVCTLVSTILLGCGISCFWCLLYDIPYIVEGAQKVPMGFTEETFMQLYSSFGMIMFTAILGPILEELWFRGIVQNLFADLLGHKGILLSVAFFAILHGRPAPFLFVTSLGMAYIYYYTKNIWYPIIYHICNNGMNVILSEMELIGPNKNMAFIIMTGGFLIAAGGALLYRSVKETKVNKEPG